eukprot:s2305_g6.t1
MNPRLKVHRETSSILIVNRQELALPEEDANKFQHLCTGMLLLLSNIPEHFIADKLFQITQKAHFLQHISLLARFLTARWTWCFMGEDMQRRISTLAKACVNGQRLGQTIQKMMRYRIALHLQFLKHE